MQGPRLEISLQHQTLHLWRGEQCMREYPVSSARNGAGEQSGSGCTPRGLHVIRARIGAGCAANTVFIGRRPSGECYTPELGRRFPERDWILSRILWLSGCEPGRNRLGKVDTLRRYIYIHGCPDELPLGVALSHGCIRMRNSDIMELFELVAPGTPVMIRE
ncbi:MAG: peptidase [Gammaproteobacteria bacterium RBG_16_57_12]|nr:MAG: peptidase [Gammaproteobacteria bacterium RBG_16_57_12]